MPKAIKRLERDGFMARKIPEILTIEEQERLLGVFNLRYPTPHRNKTMILLLLNSGLRSSEVANLKWREVNLATGQLKVVQGKGSKDRILWVSETVLDALRGYRERQYKLLGDMDYVFATRTENVLDGKAIRKMIQTYAKKAGIDKRISTHTLRRTFASDLLRETKNLRIVQKALGHADISTTQIYTHIVDDELEEALKGFRG